LAHHFIDAFALHSLPISLQFTLNLLNLLSNVTSEVKGKGTLFNDSALRQMGVNNLPRVVTQLRIYTDWGSNSRPVDRKSDALALRHRPTVISEKAFAPNYLLAEYTCCSRVVRSSRSDTDTARQHTAPHLRSGTTYGSRTRSPVLHKYRSSLNV